MKEDYCKRPIERQRSCGNCVHLCTKHGGDYEGFLCWNYFCCKDKTLVKLNAKTEIWSKECAFYEEATRK